MVALGPFTVRATRASYPEYCEDDGPCPIGTECRQDGFCSGTDHESCDFDEHGEVVRATTNGDPCAIARVHDNGAASGIGMSAEFCLALNDPESLEAIRFGDVFPEGCRWMDGSPVTTLSGGQCYGFPAYLYGDDWFEMWHFCGGSCGNAPCGEIGEYDGTFLSLLAGPSGASTCVGRSDERAFGACTVGGERCSATANRRVRDCDHWLSEPLHGQQICSCLFTDEDGSDPEAEGWVVPQTVCLRYREIYPESVYCRSPSFELLP